MVYIDSTTNTLTIPKHIELDNPTFTLELTNNITNQTYTFENLHPNENSNNYMYVIPFVLENIPTGEYFYKLSDGGENVAEFGLLNYGNYTPENTQYNNETNRVQYNG